MAENGRRSSGARQIIALANERWAAGQSVQAIALSERAVAALSSKRTGWQTKARLELAQLYMLMGRETAGLEILEEIGRDDCSIEFRDMARLMELRGFAYQRMGDAKACIVLYEQAWRLLRSRIEEHIGDGLAFLDRYAVAARDLGLMSLAHDVHQEQMRLVTDETGPIGWEARLSASGTLLLVGDFQRAHNLLEPLPPYQDLTSLQRMDLVYQQMLIGFALGDDESVIRFADESVLKEALEFGAPHRIGQVTAAFHRYRVDRRSYAEASSLLARAVKGLTSGDGTWWLAIRVCEYGSTNDIGRLRDLMHRLGHENAVARLHASLLSCCLDRANGQIENGARAKLLSIADAFRRMGWRCHEAFALEYAGERHRAQQIYGQLGMRGEAKKLTLRSHRSRIVPRAQNQQLTQREHDVVALVRDGRSNLEIAKTLGIKKGTVEQHLYWIFTKLGVSSRQQLAGRATP